MFQFSLADIASITSSECEGNGNIKITKIQTDSRTSFDEISAIFLALKGVSRNGHDYIADMHERGCRNFWVEKGESYPKFSDSNYIISSSVLYSFQKLLSHYRQAFFTNPIVAVTGSNGKTIIKEWLYFLMKQTTKVVRSPRSYNSQIGVPLSLMLLDNSYSYGIIEAGISEVGEMEKLEKMILPTVGIFSNIGDAHQQHFTSLEQKVQEKMKLFAHVDTLVYCSDYAPIDENAKLLKSAKLVAWGFSEQAKHRVSYVSNAETTVITAAWNNKKYTFEIPFRDAASIENAVHCFYAIQVLGVSVDLELFKTLPTVAMRLEQISGRNNCVLINDSYNSDFQSVKIALQYLSQQHKNASKTLVLSDVKQTGMNFDELYSSIADMVREYSINRVIGVGKDISKYLKKYLPTGNYYASTNALLPKFHEFAFQNETILFKAAREFEFERLVAQLELQMHQTVLEVNLNAIVHNLNYFRSCLNPKTKMMIMVKASCYGNGTYEIANILQHNKVDYLAVAFIDEGVELRNSGITVPIIVMNPEYGMLSKLYDYGLEPNIHNFAVLNELQQLCASYPNKTFPIHLKMDTGMARYGFQPHQIPQLIEEVKAIPNCQITSIFSHLVGSDDSQFDSFTMEQLELFKQMSSEIMNAFPYPIMRHILNSAGIERFREYQFDMVRLGIGLYGISFDNPQNCQHISTLKTFVSGIREKKSNTSVGYSRKGMLHRDSKIAVIPIGYADGFNRKLSNGVGTVLVRGKEVPIVGNICMDAAMIDVTDVPDIQLGDEVILFGKDLPITKMAERIGTIPYEVMTSIDRRVKRIYVYE
ncbi:MAG: bifunctional UDP-N-acetylmuramoyl-tripeptide:D-alanyl-D-alanine ligase/alanine racemase [Bacteroidales bacterium]|nr:bifunctional UDP-N-acetylmuramoyl-tripeptide:D-alanyl-D-alanine ligase/alanine racemase [Bacteroidales bacterium]